MALVWQILLFFYSIDGVGGLHHNILFEVLSYVNILIMSLFSLSFPYGNHLSRCCCWKPWSDVVYLFLILWWQSTRIEDIWFSLRTTGIIHSKQDLIIDLKKLLYIAERLDISEQVWRHPWWKYRYEEAI